MIKDFRTLETVLKQYETPFLRELDLMARNCIKEGEKRENSPAFVTFQHINDKKLIFISSQTFKPVFSVDIIDPDDIDQFLGCDPHFIISFFRELKYSFLQSQYPQIKTLRKL